MKGQWARTISLLIILAVIIGTNWIIPLQKMISYPYNYIGLLVIILGIAIDVWAAYIFRTLSTTFKLRGETTSLITTGPFGLSRNPIYLGIFLVLLGMAIFLGSLISFFYPIIFFVFSNFVLVPMEERRLESLFGLSYINYKKKVRRWL